jgi:S1-C subfamily serine protease
LRQGIGGADTHRSEGSLRSHGSSSFQRQYEQQETLGGSSSGHHPVIAALQSCVKVFCTAVAPSYMLPWMRGEESHRVGSGFAAILPSGERRLFTHAQVVENCTLVQVRRAVDAQKFVARVVHVGFDVDIAVLHVDDPSFWEAIPALPLTTALPGIMTEVMAVGFAMGGDELSTTRGVVNRITLGGTTRELCLQIDATFNPGNAGGPVLGPSGSLIGMSASNSAQAQNEGYIIPMPVIHTFLQNVANAARDGLPYQGRATDCFRLQPLENLALRVQLGLPARPGAGEDGGVLVSMLPPDAAAVDVLKEGDVILALDGHPIAADGTAVLPEMPDGVRLGMRYLVQRALPGSTLTYLVLRDGQRMELPLLATPRKPRLMPPRQPPPRPQWLVLGGLVFTPLLPDYEAVVPKSHLQMVHGPPSFEGQQVVLLLHVLQAEINIGCEDICGVLESFNGVPVRSLRHLYEMSEAARCGPAASEQLDFLLVTGELLVIDAPRCWQTEEEIFSMHSIPKRASLTPLASTGH